MNKKYPNGVFAAALTPLKADGSLDLDNVLPYLNFLAERGCNGALLFGTTGEGPSFDPKERLILGRVALEIHNFRPDFMLMMGTGTPSLTETMDLTRNAFEIGMQGVVVLPPYFNRKVSDDGLFEWFSEVIRKAVPEDKFLLGYHIPQMTGVPFSINLLDRLKSAFPSRFAGIKNSGLDEAFVDAVGSHFGSDMVVLTGFDNFLQITMEKGGRGCITASATLVSPLLREVFDDMVSGKNPSTIQAKLNQIRAVMDNYPPAPALIKGLLARWHNFPLWKVRFPLMPIGQDVIELAANALNGPF